MGAQSDLSRFAKKEVENNRKYEEMPAVSMSAFPEGWTFGGDGKVKVKHGASLSNGLGAVPDL